MTVVIDQLMQEGAQARREHRSADAKRHFAEAVEVCRANGLQPDLAGALKALGQVERDLGHNDDALRLYQEAVVIYTAEGDALQQAHTVRHVADILLVSGRHIQAEPCYEEALKIYRSHEQTQPLDLANAIRGMAMLKQETRNVDQAKALWEEARALYAAVNVEAGVAESNRRIAQLTK